MKKSGLGLPEPRQPGTKGYRNSLAQTALRFARLQAEHARALQELLEVFDNLKPGENIKARGYNEQGPSRTFHTKEEFLAFWNVEYQRAFNRFNGVDVEPVIDLPLLNT
jgi:hypothetical protein